MGARPCADPDRPARLLLAAILLCTVTGCPFRAKPGEAPLVGDIHIVGNHHVPAGDIVGELALTKSGTRFIIKFGDAFPFDPEIIRVDRLRIVRIYQAHGYYKARVTDVKTQLDRGRINIWFYVIEGPSTTTSALDIHGLEAIPNDIRQFVLRRLPLARGDVLTESGYEETKATIVSRLKSAGYWQANDEGHVTVAADTRSGAIAITTTTGPRYRIAAIDVTGTKNVALRRIVEASELKPGQYISPGLLSSARNKVNAMGVFAEVEIQPGLFNPVDAVVPVTIKVVEAPFQVVNAGAGIEIEQTEQMVRAKAVYTNKNLAHDLQKIIVGGSLGYAFVPTVFSFFGPGGTARESGIVADLEFTYVQPRIFHAPIDFTAGVDYSKDLELAFAYQRIGAHTGLVFTIPHIKGLTIAPSLNYDYYFDATSGTPQPTIPGQPLAAFTASGCGPNEQNVVTPDCTIGYAQLQINLDQRDDPLATRSGYFISLNAQYASRAVSDFNFVEFSPEARGYVPLTPYLTFAARLHYGVLAQIGSGGRAPPGVARFFSGGANSDRTVGAEELGPREYIVVPNTGSGGPFIAGAPIPVGGDHLLEGNAELRWYTPLKGLVVVGFFDIARLQLLYTPPGQQQIPSTDGGFQYGPGFGLRYYTPFGPLRVDFAYRISSLDALPVSVDTTNVKNPATSNVPTSVLSSTGTPNYRFAGTCPGQQQSYQCYSDNRFQFFITLGEAF